MDKITKEQVSALIAKELKEMELNGAFNEETLNQIQEKVSNRLQDNGSILEEEVVYDQENEPTNTNNSIPVVTKKYEPELPSFLDKIEPAKFIIFNMNEVSLGGEQLSNKPFRLFSDPDLKKSIHDAWKEEGKQKAEIYIAKFEKIGSVDFDYRNGTSYFTEKRFENPEIPSVPVYQENPYASIPKPEEIENIPTETSPINLEEKVKEYIENILRRHFSGSSHETEVEEDETIEKPESSDLKYRDIVMNENEFIKVDTPKSLIESIESGKGNAKLISKNNEVQTWVLEGIEYYLPIEIMSNKKCHTRNTL